MNTNQLEAALQGAVQDHGGKLSARGARKATKELLGAMVEGLRRDGQVEIRGFGSFRLVSRSARKARNVHTGAIIDIPARQAVMFKASKALRTSVQE